MRFLAIAILVLFLAAGVVVGALNAGAVSYDLGFVRIEVPKGAAVLLVLVLGWVLGGLTAWLGVSVGRRRRRRESPSGVPAGKA